MSVTDLSTEELEAVQQRLDRLLESGGLPYYAIQYRLAEVGRRRADPRALSRALAELANNRRPRRGKLDAGPWEKSARVYVSGAATQDEAIAESALVTASARSLSERDWRKPFTSLVEAISRLPGVRLSKLSQPTAESRLVADDVEIPAISQQMQLVPKRGLRANLWVSHDLDPIYPDDWRLWQLLHRSIEQDVPAILVARKIATPTFVLLKHVRAIGLQYYSTLVPDDELLGVRAAAERIRWTHLLPTNAIESHAVMPSITATIERLNEWHLPAEVKDGIGEGSAYGLGTPDESDVGALLEWAVSTTLPLPKPWIGTVQKWVAWADYQTPSRRGRRRKIQLPLSTNGEPPTMEQTAPERSEEPKREVRLNDEGEEHTGWGWGRRTKIFKFGRTVRWDP